MIQHIDSSLLTSSIRKNSFLAKGFYCESSHTRISKFMATFIIDLEQYTPLGSSIKAHTESLGLVDDIQPHYITEEHTVRLC